LFLNLTTRSKLKCRYRESRFDTGDIPRSDQAFWRLSLRHPTSSQAIQIGIDHVRCQLDRGYGSFFFWQTDSSSKVLHGSMAAKAADDPNASTKIRDFQKA